MSTQKFCYACGRVISRAKNDVKVSTQKYCSHSCKTHKPSPLDLRIEEVFIQALSTCKDRKNGVRCGSVEEEIFSLENGGRTEDGMERARERERVRRAGRRLVVFAEEKESVRSVIGKRLECVQGGKVVEGSFAKGDWGVRVVEGDYGFGKT